MLTSNTIESGVTATTSQVTLRDSITTTLRFMALMISPGDQMVSRTHTPTTMTTTTGTIRVMPLFATDVVDMDASFAPDTDINTEMPPLETMDILLRLDLAMVTPMPTLETSQDPLTINMDMELVDVILRDGAMVMEADMVLDTDTDTDLHTDGLVTTDMDMVTQVPRDLSWVMVLVLTLKSHNNGKSPTTSRDTTEKTNSSDKANFVH